MPQSLVIPYRDISTGKDVELVRFELKMELSNSDLVIDGYRSTRWKLFHCLSDREDFILSMTLSDVRANLIHLCFLKVRVFCNSDVTIARLEFRLTDALPLPVSDLIQIGTEDYVTRLVS